MRRWLLRPAVIWPGQENPSRWPTLVSWISPLSLQLNRCSRSQSKEACRRAIGSQRIVSKWTGRIYWRTWSCRKSACSSPCRQSSLNLSLSWSLSSSTCKPTHFGTPQTIYPSTNPSLWTSSFGWLGFAAGLGKSCSMPKGRRRCRLGRIQSLVGPAALTGCLVCSKTSCLGHRRTTRTSFSSVTAIIQLLPAWNTLLLSWAQTHGRLLPSRTRLSAAVESRLLWNLARSSIADYLVSSKLF